MSAFIEERRDDFGVAPICRTLEASASAHYARANGPPSRRAVEDERLLGLILETWKANYCAYGYRRTWKALQRLWVCDLTYLRSWQGTSFLAFVIDAFSRRVVGWQLAGHMRTDLVLDALRMALHSRGPGADVELVHHSDRGSQYTSIDYAQELTDHGVLASVGSVGDAYDNAMAESFVDSLKTELIADRSWRSRSQLEMAVVEYLGWFNNDRLHESLGDIPPAEFEALYAPKELSTAP